MTAERFGCERCWPESAQAASDNLFALVHEAELIDESHYHVAIRRCAACSQRFVWVFTETIDWTGGNDPQYWTLIPVTDQESAALRQAGEALSERELEALPADRPSLQRDWPSSGAMRSYWGRGLHIGPHD
ncbi:MAG TPA: hypothetical protein VFT99_02615 [Roseiflexaceae bacterium]|nr:hypothetical protein [Roseiflexaceae bacterium]